LRAKFTNDSNFFVREVEQGSGVLERSLEIAVLRGGGRRWWRQEAGLAILLLCLLFYDRAEKSVCWICQPFHGTLSSVYV